jgi:hypothetical protein
VVNYTTSWLDDGCSGGPFVPRSCSYSFSRDKKVHQRRATGDSTDASLDEVVARLSDLGYTAQKLPGPLLLATTGGNRQVPKLMPTFMLFRTLFVAVELSTVELSRRCRGSVEPLSRPLSRPSLSSLVEPVEFLSSSCRACRA